MLRKRFMSVVLAALVCFMQLAAPVLANDIIITGKYEGKLIFESDNDYVFKASNAMPGQEWQTRLYFKNTSDYVIDMELNSITDNGSDEVLLSNMYLSLDADGQSVFDGDYPYELVPVTDVFQIPAKSEVIMTATLGISPLASNGIMNKSMNTSWVFSGTLLDPRNAGDFTDADGYVLITDDEGNSYKVKVINHEDNPVENAHVEIKDGNIVIDLPDGETVTKQTPVTVIVTDDKDTPIRAIPVEVRDIDGDDFVNKTNANGKAVVPVLNEGYTDIDGNVSLVDENGNVFNINVAEFEGEPIEDAFVTVTEDGVTVLLPDGRILTRDSAVVVTVKDEEMTPVKDVPVTAEDEADNSFSDTTNEKGETVLPILRENYTDENGVTEVIDDNGNRYIVTVKDDNEKPIENAWVKVDENGISVVLPDGTELDIDNPTHVIVTNKDEIPVPMVSVTVSDDDETVLSVTDSTGEIIVPVSPEGVTTKDGHVRITGDDGEVYKVYVSDESGNPIRDAVVEITDEGVINIVLPEPIDMTPYSPVTILVTDKNDEPRENVPITVKADNGIEGEDTTDIGGTAKIPVSDEALTDETGTAPVTSREGVRYIVNVVSEKDGAIPGALIQVKDNKIEVFLPEGYSVNPSNQTTVTVIDSDFNKIEGLSVTVTDKDEKTASKLTDAKGQIVVPNKPAPQTGGGGGGGGGDVNTLVIYYRNADGTAGDKVSEITAKAGDESAKLIGVIKNKIKDMTITWTSDNESVAIVDENGVVAFVGEGEATITAQSNSSKALVSTVKVTVKPADKKPVETAEPVVEKHKRVRGSLISPYMFAPYISGYEDGSFHPDSPISREELSAIFARIIANKLYMDKDYATEFPDVPDNWSKSYIGYLEQFDIVTGYEDGLFRPYNKITRAEMAVMLAKTLGYDITPDIKAEDVGFKDVDDGYAGWSAAKAIYILSDLGIMTGYPDGTFRPGQSITRSEVVSTINRVLTAQEVVNYKNKPADMTDAHWAYENVLFAMNARKLKAEQNAEEWSEWFETAVPVASKPASWSDYKDSTVTGDGNNGTKVSDNAVSQNTDDMQVITMTDSDGNMEVKLYAPNDINSMRKGLPKGTIIVIAVSGITAALFTARGMIKKRKKRGRA